MNLELLKTDDLKKIFGISRPTIYEWLKNEDFPKPVKIGSQNFWYKSEIEAYLESKRKA